MRIFDQNFRPALIQQWNLTIQHQFSNTLTFQIGYVGQHGTHLIAAMPFFQKQLVTPGQALTFRAKCDGTVPEVERSYGNR